MNAIGFAWRSLVRQPARAALGILGVAAVGALLFDMLLLSRGLIVSMQDLLDRGGWDVRVSAGELPGSGLRISDAVDTAEAIVETPFSAGGTRHARGHRTDRPGLWSAAPRVVSRGDDAFCRSGGLAPSRSLDDPART